MTRADTVGDPFGTAAEYAALDAGMAVANCATVTLQISFADTLCAPTREENLGRRQKK